MKHFQNYGNLKTYENIRKELDIIENVYKIGNLDETPIWFEMYNKTTIDKIANKTIKVKHLFQIKTGYQCF